MATTAILLTLAGLVALACVGIWATLLKFGLYWAKCEDRSTKKTLLFAFFYAFVFRVSIGILLIPIWNDEISNRQALALVVATEVAIPCLLISYFFSTNLRRAFQAWLPTILTLIPAILIVLAFRQFAFEAFACPTNAMAPTILGYHATGKCDECGETCFGPPPNMRHRRLETHTICSNYHLSTKETVGRGTDGDRFLVSKFLTPKRWDAMVFRYPEDPTMLYVMRVVGMPGDDLYIHDGKVWVNGKPLSPPAHLNGIEYASDFPSFSNTLSGTIENPAELADDEYFVLGDFTTQSKDSRFWQTANNGRPPYSVPASSVYGIVTHIYWPPSRMTTLR